MRKLPQFVIAAPTSGAGKTTVSRGLMALLTAKGYRIQPFKCGPDYIDTIFHAQVCHRPSYNLDTFMASQNHVRQLYALKAQEADACIVEGMMGMTATKVLVLKSQAFLNCLWCLWSTPNLPLIRWLLC